MDASIWSNELIEVCCDILTLWLSYTVFEKELLITLLTRKLSI